MNMFRNKCKTKHAEEGESRQSTFYVGFFFQVGGSFPKMWEVSECMDRCGRGGVRGLQPAAFQSGLVQRFIASICLFSVVC